MMIHSHYRSFHVEVSKKIGVPLVIIHFSGFFNKNYPFLGTRILKKTPKCHSQEFPRRLAPVPSGKLIACYRMGPPIYKLVYKLL